MELARPVAWMLLGAAAGAAFCVTTARAETFKWVDAQGRIQYTDRLPPEAVNRGNVQMSKQGVAKTVTDPSLTAEQRLAIEDRLAREREVEKQAKERRHQESALLSSYTSEDDIEIARKRNLALIGASIQASESRIKTLQQRAVDLEKEKLFYEKKSFPERLRRELVAVQAEIPRQSPIIAQKNQEALAINQRFDDQRAQYVEIRGRLAQSQGVKRQ